MAANGVLWIQAVGVFKTPSKALTYIVQRFLFHIRHCTTWNSDNHYVINVGRKPPTCAVTIFP